MVSASHPLFALLRRLELARIHFSVARARADTIRVDLMVPGERIEVDVFEDGHMEVSRFRGSEDIVGGEEVVLELIRKHGEPTI